LIPLLRLQNFCFSDGILRQGRLKTIRLAPAIKEGGGLFKPAAVCHMMCRLFETFTLRLYQSGWR
jgi:hypothetical protein